MDSTEVKFLVGDQVRCLRLYAESENSLFKIDYAEALEHGEAEIQLLEGRSYEYVLDEGFTLETSDIFIRSKVNRFAGRISPNIYVGTLAVGIIDVSTNEKCAEINVEVRSTKTNYRTDYRQMLEDIAEHCTELLISQNSLITQKFTTDYYKDAQSLYQRFAFLRSIIDTPEFDNSIHKIMSSPVTQWKETGCYRDIRSMRKVNNKIVRQIVGAKNRMNLSESHPLSGKLESVPQKIFLNHKEETTDTPENRFIKYALQSFFLLCDVLKQNPKANQRLKQEASAVLNRLERYLNSSLFKEISIPTIVFFNSPVLQKKEGYREVLRVWLMFDLAAKLTWQGGEDVYEGGKKDIAVLYEYWLFFKLLDLVKEVFKIEPKSIDTLIKATDDGLGLQLRQGRFIAIEGIYEAGVRDLNIEFSYNKTFSGKSIYPRGGSWTGNMRPDYTLTIWPFGVTKEKAEEEELIVHIHFDAKYKIETLTEIFAPETNLDVEKEQERKGTYKRGDILKMHAYKDAIRRTGGAYVLYPGTESAKITGFHEIIPGLGAFAINPSQQSTGLNDLRDFLRSVSDHFLNRASQREKMSYQNFFIYKNGSPNEVKEKLPETVGVNRNLLPDETHVLVGFYRDSEHLKWIVRSGLYNARAETNRGSLRLGPGESNARYVLLHSTNELKSSHLFRVLEKGPRVFSADKLVQLGYPQHPGQDFYLVYKVIEIDEPELQNRKWDISNLGVYKSGRNSAIPFAVTLTELMRVTVEISQI